MNRIIIEKNSFSLSLTLSKIINFIWLVGYLFFFTIWYFFLFNFFSSVKVEFDFENLFNCIMLIFPLLFIPKLYKLVKIVLIGRIYTLDKTGNNFCYNKKEISKLNEIDNVYIRTIYNSDGSDEYMLFLELKNGKKIKIDHSTKIDEYLGVADELADFLNVPIMKK